MSADKVGALLNPTSVAIVGAREDPSGWTARIFANLTRFHFAGPVYPINPRLDEIWGVRCFRDLTTLPSTPDHLVVMRGADDVPGTLAEGARAGARSATIYATGFAETATDHGRKLQDAVRALIEETGMGISGPNCLGNLSAPARLLTLPDDRIRELAVGPVAIVGQSGTSTPAIGRALIERGIGVSYIVTSGNEIGLKTADYISYFARDPRIKVIFCVIEAVRGPDAFLKACRAATDAGKSIVALKMGGSAKGRAAALAHTGSLAGAVEVFEAIAGECGVLAASTADEAINLIEFLVASPAPKSDGVGVLVYSGGLGGLAVDAADRQGVPLPSFSQETVARLKSILGDQIKVSNPLDAAYVGLPLNKLVALVRAIRDDPGVGALLLQEDIPGAEGDNDANKRRVERVGMSLAAIDAELCDHDGKPISLISVASSDVTPFARQIRRRFPHLASLNEPDRAFRVLRAVNERSLRLAIAAENVHRPVEAQFPTASKHLQSWVSLAPGVALNEPQSKALLRDYGIRCPEERVVRSPDEAASAAEAIGFPVVVKAVASQLAHKTEAGGVLLSLSTPEMVRAACTQISSNIGAYNPAIRLEGWLVAKQISGGVELILGIQNDPEMGPVVMFGSGGIFLELIKDVAFGPPGLNRSQADRLIAKTRAGTLLRGYRGRSACDVEAVRDAIVATGRLAADLGRAMQSLDINPFVALPAGEGAWALDALVVLGDR